MLYLFNSAYRPRYVKNVLNTLYLPGSCANEYRYKYRGESPNISAGFLTELPNLTGTECLIVFIDRYAVGGYEYHCLRRGTLLSSRVAQDYLYLRVQLGDYVCPRSVAQFKRNLLGQIEQSNPPRLTNGNPEEPHDGHYAIVAHSILEPADDFQIGDDAWSTTVDRLAATRSLRSDNDQAPVFLQGKLRKRDDDRAVVPVLQRNLPVFNLTTAKVYELVLTYRFPKQRLDHAFECQVKVALGDNLRPLVSNTLAIDSYSNSIAIPFTSKRFSEENSGHIGFENSESGIPLVLRPDGVFEYVLNEGGAFWLQVALALVIYAISGALIGADLGAIWPISRSVWLLKVIPKAILALAQGLVLLWMLSRLRRKIV